jgi:hypothetical protein
VTLGEELDQQFRLVWTRSNLLDVASNLLLRRCFVQPHAFKIMCKRDRSALPLSFLRFEKAKKFVSTGFGVLSRGFHELVQIRSDFFCIAARRVQQCVKQ